MFIGLQRAVNKAQDRHKF